MKLPAFKAYDIRGTVPTDLNPHMAYWLGRGFARITGARSAVLGMDARQSSSELLAALAHGLADEGTTTHTLGLCGTEEVYFATGHNGLDIGLMVTASHNPAQDNGIKPIRAGGAPFSGEDMAALHTFTVAHLNEPVPATTPPAPQPLNLRAAYVEKVLSFIRREALKPFTLVINSGNGAAGPTADALLAKLPFTVHRLQHTPDGTFPHGVPNPLLPHNREATGQAVRQHGAHLGIAWDGDFDRCFLFDETGTFVPPYYLLGLLAESMLEANPGATIVHDPRLYWDTLATIRNHGGHAATCKAGHINFKAKLRETGAVMGGETSAHFFFKEFYSCDSGMVPWLLVAQLMSRTGQPLSELVAARRAAVHSLDETNFRLTTPAPEVLGAIASHFATATPERIDGLSLTAPDGTWRTNLRASNTEPVLRLNLEARSAEALQHAQTELLTLLTSLGATPA